LSNSAFGPLACVHARPGRNVQNRRDHSESLVLVVLVGVPDLPRVLVGRLRPLGVPLHHRRVLDVELRGQVLDHRPRGVEWIVRENRPM